MNLTCTIVSLTVTLIAGIVEIANVTLLNAVKAKGTLPWTVGSKEVCDLQGELHI